MVKKRLKNLVFEMVMKKKKVMITKKPVFIGNSKGFRIRKDEYDLRLNKVYKIIILEEE